MVRGEYKTLHEKIKRERERQNLTRKIETTRILTRSLTYTNAYLPTPPQGIKENETAKHAKPAKGDIAF